MTTALSSVSVVFGRELRDTACRYFSGCVPRICRGDGRLRFGGRCPWQRRYGVIPSWMPWLFGVLLSAIGMRLWAADRQFGTIELLMTMPVPPWTIVAGKFPAGWALPALRLH